MLAILVSIFAVVFISSLESYGRSYSEEINYYREAVRHALLDHTFDSLANRNEQLGMWPSDIEGLAQLSNYYLGATSNFLLSDDELNIHTLYLRYERSAERGSIYESDRAVLLAESRETDPEESLLAGGYNACGDSSFDEGFSWCPPDVLNRDEKVLRSSTQQAVSLSVSEQEVYVRHLANRVTNYINVNGALPSTPGGADVPLHSHIRDGSGDLYDPTRPCDSAAQYTWSGIPVTCQDMFSVWHIDNDENDTRDTLSGIYGVNSMSRFDVPVSVYRSGNSITIYVETPFEFYGESAWGATSNIRGELRPSSSSPMYVFTTVSYNPAP